MSRTNLWRKLRGKDGPKPPRRSKEMPCLRAEHRRLYRTKMPLPSLPPGPNRAERRKGVPAVVAGTKVFVRLRHGRYVPYLYLDGRR